MKIVSILVCLLILVGTVNVSAQDIVGKKLKPVKILNENNENTDIQMLGKAPLLVFYQDPKAAAQNKMFRDSLKTIRKENEKIQACAIINFLDAPGLPEFLVKMVAKGEVKGSGAQLYYDMVHTVSKTWALGDVKGKCCIIFINPKGVVEFYKAGELTAAEKNALLKLLMKYK